MIVCIAMGIGMILGASLVIIVFREAGRHSEEEKTESIEKREEVPAENKELMRQIENFLNYNGTEAGQKDLVNKE